MAATQTNKPTVVLAAANDVIAGNTDILAVHIISASGEAGDSVILHDDDGDVIDSYIVDGENYDREYVINAKWAGVLLETNTGDRATVMIKRAHSNMGIGTVRQDTVLGG